MGEIVFFYTSKPPHTVVFKDKVDRKCLEAVMKTIEEYKRRQGQCR